MLLVNMEKRNKRKRVNVRRPEIMEKVNAEVKSNFHSSLVSFLKENNQSFQLGNITLFLAKKFGFCYGVERAIDTAYAARKAFPDKRIFIIGELIHNEEVNKEILQQNIIQLPWKDLEIKDLNLKEEDIVILPAFGTRTEFIKDMEEIGCQIVDATCGDVIKVWKRIEQYGKEEITSIIHGKIAHEETLATISHTKKGSHYLVIFNLEEAQIVSDFITEKKGEDTLLKALGNKCSQGFNPRKHLQKIGIANQTTMLKSETEEIQNLLKEAIKIRDKHTENFYAFNTICGATQVRQDALFNLTKNPPDLLIVVGSYNSSNTSHLAEIGEKKTNTFFIRNESCLKNLEEISHFDLITKTEKLTKQNKFLEKAKPIRIGITSGASCPNNLIEKVIFRLFELRGFSNNEVLEKYHSLRKQV